VYRERQRLRRGLAVPLTSAAAVRWHDAGSATPKSGTHANARLPARRQ
jgi:hypothetical protein